MDLHLFFKLHATFIGALLGSLGNVFIYRIPREIGLFWPRSACPSCKKNIPAYHLIPILSYLLLKGRCSNCKKRISVRYPLVELFMAVHAFFLFPADMNITTISIYTFQLMTLLVFVAHFAIDLEHYILPDILNFYLLILFWTYSLCFLNLKLSLYGMMIGAGIPWMISFWFTKVRKKQGMGLGDVKLYGVLGVYLGPLYIVYNLFLSCFLGTLVAGGLILLKKMSAERPIPFGPFILLVAYCQIFFPNILPKLFSFMATL